MRYNITLKHDRGGFYSSALAEQFGNVVSTVQRYDGQGNDLAIIEIAAGAGDPILDEFQRELDEDENVLSYRTGL